MASSVAERSRRFHARRRATAEAELRDAYAQQRERLAKEKVRTLAHFRRWTSQLRLDTGAKWKLEPFQEAFVRDLFAGRPQNWLIVPEGNAKSTLVAGIALYHLQHTLDASIAVGASSREQANVIYEQAQGFIDRARDDELASFKDFELHPGYRRIDHLPTRSRLQVRAADADTGDGLIPTLCLIDELHRHKNLNLYRTWLGKLGKRNGQMIVISTAGEPGSEFETVRQRIRQDASAATQRKACFIRAASNRVVFHEWAVPEEGDVEDFALVKKANPLKTITVSGLREKFHDPGTELGHWRRLTCNLPTRGELAAISEKEWEAARTETRIPEGQPIWLGIDVGWIWDTTALVPLWVRDPEFRLLGPAMVLTPPRDGSMLEEEVVKRAIVVIHERNPIQAVVMDPSQAMELARWIEQTIGTSVMLRKEMPSIAAENYQRFMEALRLGWLKHSGDQALTRHALNAIARTMTYGDTRFDRISQTRQGGDQERRVIDALTAAANVHAVATAQVQAAPEPWFAFG